MSCNLKITDGKNIYEIVISKNKSILDSATENNINMPYSCQSGLCTACKTLLVKGKVYMTENEGLSNEDINNNYILTCVSFPESDDIEIVI